jgi:hypothetical protein
VLCKVLLDMTGPMTGREARSLLRNPAQSKEEDMSVGLFPQGAPGLIGVPGPKGVKGDSRTITTKGQSM